MLSHPPDPSHPHYTDIMSNYIDFTIIERKLKVGDYGGTFNFVQDIRSVFDKVFHNYAENPLIITRTREIANYFESRVKEIEQLPLKEIY